MLSVKRLEEIIKILEKEGSADACFLSEHFGVTPKTIRMDFNRLEEMGLIERVHGGAVLKQNGSSVYPIEKRKQRHTEEKARIGQAALNYVEDGDTIILDGGSTTLQLARLLGEKKVTVVTNDLVIAWELMNKDNITLYVTGGRLRREGAFTLVGRDAERSLEKYYARKLFLGTSALDFRRGLMVLSSDEAEVKRAMLHAAEEIICLADYSKFHNLAFVTFCALDTIDTLITDERITAEDIKYLEERGIKVNAV